MFRLFEGLATATCELIMFLLSRNLWESVNKNVKVCLSASGCPMVSGFWFKVTFRSILASVLWKRKSPRVRTSFACSIFSYLRRMWRLCRSWSPDMRCCLSCNYPLTRPCYSWSYWPDNNTKQADAPSSSEIYNPDAFVWLTRTLSS